jgi:hypothetical protein
MVSRLPVPGSDDNTWGMVLNDFLAQAHNTDGTLKDGSVSDSVVAASPGISQSKIQNLTATLAAKVDTSTITTKGDLLAGTAASTISRFGVGSNFQVLKANSATATGIEWADDRVTNVKEYGATGNGSTDDTAAIQAAVAAAKTGTQVLFFPAGTYIISAPLNVGGGFPGALQIYGVGWDSQIKLANNANCYLFVLNNVYTPGLVICDLYLNCNGANQTSESGGIDAYGAVHSRFERLQIDTPFYDGIFLHRDGTGTFGHDNLIIGCWFVNGKNATGPGQGLEIFESDENFVVNCTFMDNGNPNNTYPWHNVAQYSGPFQVYESAGAQHFLGNNFVNGGQGVTMMRTIGNRNMFINNTFDGGSGNQLHVNSIACIVQGNTFINIGSRATVGNPSVGLYLDSQVKNIVAGNVFSPIAGGSGYAQAGIWTDFGADNNNIINNVFSLDGISGGAWQYGPIRLNSGGGHNTLGSNNGFVSEAVGTVNVTTLQTSVTVSHGMALTPASVTVTPQGNPGTVTWWITAVTGTQFTLNVSSAPASTLAFFWRAEALQG